MIYKIKTNIEVIRVAFIAGNKATSVTWGSLCRWSWGSGQSHSGDSAHNQQLELSISRLEWPGAPGTLFWAELSNTWKANLKAEVSIKLNCLSITNWARPFWKCSTLKILLVDNRQVQGSQVVVVVKNPPANAEDLRDASLILGLGRFPWKSAWQPPPVFLPGECYGQRSLAGYSP